jgi:hypothetical protein
MRKSPKKVRGRRRERGGAVKNRVEEKQGFSPRSKAFILLQPGVSGPSPEYPGNPECPAPTPDTPLPLNPASRIFKEFDFEWIWKVAYVINVSLSSINTLD